MSANQPKDLLDAMLANPEQRLDLIGRYVRDKLGDDLLDRFETRLLDDATLLDDVEHEAALRESLQTLESAELDVSVVRPAGDGVQNAVGRRSWLALAAGLVVGAALTSAIWWGAANQSGGSGHQFASVDRSLEQALVVSVDVLRGPGQAATLVLPALEAADSRSILLQLAAPNEPGPYRITATGAGGRSAVVSGPITASADGWLLVLASPNALADVVAISIETKRGSDWAQSARVEVTRPH